MNSLGIITPEITRGIGLITDEVSRSLGLITPDITTMRLADVPPTEVIPLGATRFSIASQPLSTWGIVMGMGALGSGVAGYAATRSGRTAVISGIGGLLGGAASVAIIGFLTLRSQDKILSQTLVA